MRLDKFHYKYRLILRDLDPLASGRLDLVFITQRFCSFKFRSTSLREARHRWSLWEFCSTYLDPLASGRLDDYQQAITKWALNLDPLASGRLDGKMLKKLRSWITQFRSTSLREARL